MLASSIRAASRTVIQQITCSTRVIQAQIAPATSLAQYKTTSPASNSLFQFQSRHFSSDVTAPSPSIKLYQYHICPFCNITKSTMQYAYLDYEAVEVNPLTKAELKPLSGDYKKVPIALIDEKQINGSEDILKSILESPFVAETLSKQWSSNNDENESMTMQQFKDSESAKRWFRFAADDLGAVLYPNICGTLSDSFDAFSYVKNVDSFTRMQKVSIQYLGALAMYFAASKVKSKRNITDEKAALQSSLDTYENEGLKNGALQFSSGNPSTPDMGDIAVFGVLYAIRDMKAHADAVQNRGGFIKDWYERMEKVVVK